VFHRGAALNHYRPLDPESNNDTEYENKVDDVYDVTLHDGNHLNNLAGL